MADNKREYYTHSNARGGGPKSHSAHVASMRKVDSKTSHLTQGTGGKVKAAGDQAPHETSKPISNTMGKAKKIAGGSNY